MFGLLLSCIYIFFENLLKEITVIYNEKNGKFIWLIFLLLLDYFLCGGRNVYRLVTNKLYFPITRSFIDSIFDPLFLIYYFFFENDFHSDKDIQSIVYFLINLIISIIYVFFGSVYNEVFVLFCCKLEYETHFKISKRSNLIENKHIYNVNDEAINDDIDELDL